jgi:cytochrome c556
MNRNVIARAALVLGTVLASLALGADVGPTRGPGWTGITNTRDVIAARLELMEHIEELMEPIDTLQVKDGGDPQRLHTSAEVIGAMLTALPHLFPPTTNLYDPKALEPKTLALPTIWKDWDSFYRLAGAASAAADRMAKAEGPEALRAASFALRGSCDGCHALFLRKYVPPKVLDSDVNFDFDAHLPKR